MATVINSVFAILLLFIAFCSADSIFSRVLDDISSCSKSCANTYSPHTFEKVKLTGEFSSFYVQPTTVESQQSH